MTQPWWKQSVVYQIYPKSFNDTTGNGTGDIQGIIEKLDYLNHLGVDVIWLTPIYTSPQKDNGYDISDYFNIYEEYGTMEDFERLLQEAHDRGIKIIMDIVVNHTSTEHEWFQQSKQSIDNPYRDYYFWKDPVDGGAPTNWESKFGGNAWAFDAETGQHYLHLFDVTQADLNWENEAVRKSVYDMMHFWLQKGVDGFRLDVINLISKNQAFPNDYEGDGRRFYTDGPRVHEYMHEMNQEVFSKYEMMTVGEMSSTTIDDCVKYTHPDRQELDMTFSFHHLKVDYPNGEKWTVANFDFKELKKVLSDWQVGMQQGGGWNALFWCNHDQPRVVSRFGNDTVYHRESAKMLATTIHLMRGTPYIYQGEEFGMTNPKFDTIEDYRDVESLNMYEILKEQGKTDNEILAILAQKSRDNSRTPMQWNASEQAGFTENTPWIPVAKNYQEVNAEAAVNDEHSAFYHYKKLIELRKQYDIITSGDYELLSYEDDRVFAYARHGESEKLLVVNNFYGDHTTFEVPESIDLEAYEGERILSNYEASPNVNRAIELRPYESVVYHLTK
ncbi:MULTISPECIES: alpha,alpha-phosphotrehalase [Pontibacillus]|uniref:Alpha,alpha-phosphotrehalase n=1 Tax=Pontibacillus chungwhensis TaxID=265426 RepID=A0ABY8V0X5_9BACI|nr:MULTISPECIES: alpha,alpha-phosphotrehalase [Pontibacillus]MCD5325282.1 alpha,alpha-phosphotrehalase [Pontibacillus sp. HN14]WIF97526.1 alpha,alpha-phosphotrehalase [Pontibacillus chungwhensis]